MKKEAGFSLIELVVAMAVLALIMGAMVHLFGGSVVSLHTGSKQEVVYEEARLVMNELKTTLRYADKDSITPQEPDGKTTVFTYSGTMWNRHMDIGADAASNIPYDVTVEWQEAGNGLKQLKVTRTDKTKNGDNKKVTVFPQDSANSLFKEGSAFPITWFEDSTVTLSDGSHPAMYKIALPVQYVLNGKPQLQTLITKVVPSKDEEEESIEQEMFKLYSSLVTIWHKLRNGENLTGAERLLLDDFKAYYGTTSDSLWQLGRNDRIREYLLKTKYDGKWPSMKIGGETVYINPYGYDNNKDPIIVNNIFIIGYRDPNQGTGWNVGYVYDTKEKVWYKSTISKYDFSVSNSWNNVKAEIDKRVANGTWEKVKR